MLADKTCLVLFSKSGREWCAAVSTKPFPGGRLAAATPAR
jgi:hypothetical protein